MLRPTNADKDIVASAVDAADDVLPPWNKR